MNPKASIIIPTYNSESFISEALESVRKQTATHSCFETIIIDDGSTDETKKILEAKKLQNSRTIYLPENRGVANARNVGISQSRGDLMILLDADDLLEPEAIEATLAFMDQNPVVQYSYSQHRRIDTQGRIIGERSCLPYSPNLLTHINFVGPVKCFSKRVHQKVNGYDTSLKTGEDWDHVLRISETLRKDQVVRNDQFLYLYRIHGETLSKTSQGKTKTHEDGIKIVQRMLSRRRVEGKAKFSHITEDGYTYFNWEKGDK